MTQPEFSHLLDSINALSAEQMLQLRRELDEKLTSAEPVKQPADDQSADQQLQRRLFASGLLSEIKPPITDLSAYRNRTAVPIKGEPLSETVIRERR